MRVYEDSKSHRWYVDYYFGGRRIRYPGGTRKSHADQLASWIVLEINAGTHDPAKTKAAVKGIDGESLLFDAVVAEFLKEYHPRGGTIRYYKRRSKVWLEFFAGRRLADVGSGDVERMLRARREATTAATARKDVRLARHPVQVGEAEGIHRQQPCRRGGSAAAGGELRHAAGAMAEQ